MNFISHAFVLVFNPHKPSNSASHWLFQSEKKLKIGGVIKNLRGKELKKPPVLYCFASSERANNLLYLVLLTPAM